MISFREGGVLNCLTKIQGVNINEIELYDFGWLRKCKNVLDG